jgi:hypothetical protein
VNTILSLLVAVVVLTVAVTPSIAHHSFAAEYNSEDPVEFDGTVTRVEWKNPHAHFYVDVTSPDGTVANWDMELASPNMLVRNGWKRDLLKQGDQIHVTGSRANDGTNTAATTLITLESGDELTFISNPNADR